MIIINDLHFGVKRKAGVTPQSLAAFREFQYEVLVGALSVHPGETFMILGDLFDSGHVSYEDLWRVYSLLSAHLSNGGQLILVAGNHDLTKNLEQMSAFDMLCMMLPDAECVRKPTRYGQPGDEDEFAILPHVVNQATFDEAIGELAADVTSLFYHANFDNGFAVGKDHSLNLTVEQAAKFQRVIMGHEHNRYHRSNVEVLGSPYPLTIGECSVSKGYHRWNGVSGGGLEFIETWNPTNGYCEIDWRTISASGCDQMTEKFIRITGTAQASEAAEVISLISKFRQESSAFMVANSVQVGEMQLGDVEEMTEAALEVFDPMAAIMEILPAPYAQRLKEMSHE